jgi:hypothetical protein
MSSKHTQLILHGEVMAQSEEVTFELPESLTESGLKLSKDADDACSDAGYVYCIAEYDRGKRTGNFKVGTAVDPDKQLGDLQIGNVYQLKWWGQPQYVSHRLDAEKSAHSALNGYAINSGGGAGWFHATPSEEHAFYNAYRQAVK